MATAQYMRTTCPKCGSVRARYEVDREAREVSIVCACGLSRLVYSEHGPVGSIEHRERFEPRSIPREGTLLAVYFVALIDAWPVPRNTAELARAIPDGIVKTASNCLCVLAHKRLADRVITRRGQRGGSYWRLSEPARVYLQLPPRTTDNEPDSIRT